VNQGEKSPEKETTSFLLVQFLLLVVIGTTMLQQEVCKSRTLFSSFPFPSSPALLHSCNPVPSAYTRTGDSNFGMLPLLLLAVAAIVAHCLLLLLLSSSSPRGTCRRLKI